MNYREFMRYFANLKIKLAIASVLGLIITKYSAKGDELARDEAALKRDVVSVVQVVH